MDKQNYETAKAALITAFNICAPNGKVQAAFASTISDIESDGIDAYETILKLATGMLYDGLAYGNWIGQTKGKTNNG